MDTISIIVSSLSLLVSIVSLIFCIRKYSIHERTLNEQQKQINHFKLQEYVSEINARKQAFINAVIEPFTKGSVRLKVANKGYSNARNIRVQVLSDTSGLIMSQISDIELLNPGADYAYEIHLMNGHVKTLRLKFIWDDDYESNREAETHLQIR